MTPTPPTPDIIAARLYHRADKISAKGVSALCFKRPRAINMSVSSRETWTTDDAAVTCPKCRALIVDRVAKESVSP